MMKSTSIECVCPVCGNGFIKCPSDLKRGKGIYCSVKCYRKSSRRRRVWQPIQEDDYWIVPLTKGKFAKVCDCHLSLVLNYTWSYNSNGYAKSSNRALHCVLKMHRIINCTPDDLQCDHINGDKLDNRCSNLRIATSAQNTANRTKPIRSKTGYRGVVRRNDGSKKKPFRAKYSNFCIGHFETAEEAAIAYNNKAFEIYGEFATLNIIPPDTQI